MPTRARLPLRSCRLGRVDYDDTARLQRSLRAAREDRATDDVLLLLEHDPVITCGTRTQVDEVAFARTKGIPLVAVERGGKATYHGPGQVVAYPIFGIDAVGGDVKQLVFRLEAAIIEALAANGVAASRRSGLPGVWLDPDGDAPRKIASVGLRLTRGVTFHGVALNVACDLEPFSWFTPCGIPDATMTSMARELGLEQAPAAELATLVTIVEASLESAIAAQFDMDLTPVDAADLARLADAHPTEAPQLALPGERPHAPVRVSLTTGVAG